MPNKKFNPFARKNKKKRFDPFANKNTNRFKPSKFQKKITLPSNFKAGGQSRIATNSSLGASSKKDVANSNELTPEQIAGFQSQIDAATQSVQGLAGQIDLSQVRNVPEAQDVNIGERPVTPEAQPAQVASFTQQSAEQISNAQKASEQPQETATSRAAGQLQEQIAGLQQNVNASEQEFANLASGRVQAQQDAGLFERQVQLNQDKAKLRELTNQLTTSQDEQSLIPLREKQRLRDAGVVGTKQDLARGTSQDLQDNALNSFRLGAQVRDDTNALQAKTDAINANLNVINQQFDARASQLEFDIKQKNALIQSSLTTYGDIITSEQKSQLEARKQENLIELEDRKFNNDIKKAAITEIIKNGGSGDFSNYANLTASQLVSQATTSRNGAQPSSWLNLTEREAFATLDDSQLGRWQVFNGQDAASRKQETIERGFAEAAKGTIVLIDDLLNNNTGLAGSVGTFLGSASFNPNDAEAVNKFRTDFQGLVSSETLNTLKELKATGATLGALNEKELKVLQTADTRLGMKFSGDGVFGGGEKEFLGRSNLGEADFRKRLLEIKAASQKVELLHSLGREEFIARGYNGKLDTDTLNIIHSDFLAGTLPELQQEAPRPADGARVSIGGANATITASAGSRFNKNGLDYVVDGGKGATVASPFSGTVSFVGEGDKSNGKDGFGKVVRIDLPDGTTAQFAHLDGFNATVGQTISIGDSIGLQGNSGKTFSTTGGDGSHVDLTLYNGFNKKLPIADLYQRLNNSNIS